MGRKRKTSNMKKSIAFAAAIVGTVLCFLTFLFVWDVKNQLWEQSISTIMESTKQGCYTLEMQLMNDYQTMEQVADYIKAFDSSQKEEINQALQNIAYLENGMTLHLSDGTVIPGSAQLDEEAKKQQLSGDGEKGIINPHISSVTGVNIFQIYTRVTLKDKTEGYLLKEYEVDSIVDSFTLSFYNNSGFSYVVNTDGEVLIRSPHPNSNKTVRNLFEMLPAAQNDTRKLEQFEQSLVEYNTGWAVFYYQDEKTVFCYTPLKLDTDWYLISIIPKSVVDAQTNRILTKSLGLIASVLAGISLLVLFYLRYVKKTNKRLHSQADYITHLYNAIPEGIALMTVDQPYRILQLNQEGMQLLNYPKESQQNPFSLDCLADMVYPDDLDKISEILQSKQLSESASVFETRFLRSGGSMFWASGIIEKTLDENGSPVFIATFHDITNEKLAQEEAEREKLQERITLVGAISNAYPVIISINLTKDTLNFIFAESGFLQQLGVEKKYSELFARLSSTIHGETFDEYVKRFEPANLRQLLRNKKEVYLESRQLLADGKYHWTSTQIIQVDNPYSDDELAVFISRGIDEQRYEEEQQRLALQSALENARSASEAKTRFLSNMSHDIRTPMNAIVGMTAIAASHLEEKERLFQCLKKISLSSKHLLSLINDVLDMSKIESGKLTLSYESFNIAELVSDVAELIRPQAVEKQLSMDIQLAMLKNEKVIGDPLRIRQVYINILSNAVKYTPAGGKVKIAIRQERGSKSNYANYIFSCIDNGFGMDKEFLEKLFQPFERAQNTTTSKITGTGLGMAITKNIIDLMNGGIQVTSSPDEGSTFIVSLPLQVQDAEKENIPDEWLDVHSLIIDDDLQICESAAELLEDMGLRAQFVTEGEEAVRLVVEAKDTPDPFQLVIVDWKMPGMDGIEVARRIRAEVGMDIPVIILSAYDWSEIEGDAMQAGVTTFLSKPFYRSKVCLLLHELSEDTTAFKDLHFVEKSVYTGKRLLLVEDNDLNREIANELISTTGIWIEEACDGEEAVKKVAESPEGYYDLILMDVQMPKIDGYEATRLIRGMNRTDVGKLPIIAMTANAFAEDAQEALRSGMNAHFAKPIDLKALEQLMERYLKIIPMVEI